MGLRCVVLCCVYQSLKPHGRVTMLIAKNIPDKVFVIIKLAAGFILWCDLHLCESIIVFFFNTTRCVFICVTPQNFNFGL